MSSSRPGAEQHHEGLSRRAWGIILAAGTWLVLFIAQQGVGSPLARYIEQLEHKSLDLRFQLRENIAPTQVDDSIVVLTIDQHGLDLFEHASLLAKMEGGDADGYVEDDLWPWKRALYGLVATYLKERGARAVFFDFTFTGRSVYDYDGFEMDSQEFAEACASAGIVYHSLLFEGRLDSSANGEQSVADVTTDPVLAIHSKILRALLESGAGNPLEAASLPIPVGSVLEYSAVQIPIPPLVQGAAGLGAVNASLDSDGVIRRTGLLFNFRGQTYGSIHLSLAQQILATKTVRRNESAGTLDLGSVQVPVDVEGQMMINWHGPAKSYDTGPLHRVILEANNVAQGKPAMIPAEEFKDKIVMVGTSAAGLADLKATPLDPYFPGVEVHATALDNILNDDFLRRPEAPTRHALCLLLFLVAGQLFMRQQGAGTSFLLAGGLLFTTLGTILAAFLFQSVWLDLVIPGGGLVVLFGGAQTVQYFTEGKQKRQIREVFQRYLPSTVVNEVLKVPIAELKLGGERKELTVYFSDIEGFTGISERLNPEQLVSMLNVYLSEMSDIVSQHGGTLDKYIGDCIMAFWGAPLPVDDGAVQACLAALENQKRLAVLRERFLEQGLPEIRARIGINTGPMLVGNMGSDSHFSYTVMGDAVNLASRLEGANKQYGTYLMLGELTYERAKHAIEARPLDLVKVKGKSQPVRVYELMGEKDKLDPAQEELRRIYCRGLELYAAREWQRALDVFGEALALCPTDGPTQTYIERCEYFVASPPPAEWDGVFTMTRK